MCGSAEITPEHYNECRKCFACLAFDFGRNIESNPDDREYDMWFNSTTEGRNKAELVLVSMQNTYGDGRLEWSLEQEGDYFVVRGRTRTD